MTISGSSILALGEPGTFMTQDVNIIQTQIEQRLPWIKQVSVRKQWPDELKFIWLNMCRLRGGMINTW
ncbi:cell division protein FtsQ [Escherichia coli]|uniref:Cell division protein FtsQ n=1 Tax=Escherichia coli TaxID=562 RepID=A0A377CVZ5_ECOLX|nr:cell division protein FtsQ [Escherichia coli]